MKAYQLLPWTKVVVPHDDILEGDFDLSSYAANLGQVEARASECPAVYKDPALFFRATYRTKALDELLGGVAQVLSGGGGNRVLQLRTPFGGGKTHTLIALLHLFRDRAKLDAEQLVEGYASPGKTRVAVLPCFEIDASGGRKVDGIHIRTLWGELAYRLGGAEAFQIMREADAARTNPGAERLRQLLDGQPTLVLLDEVLTYVEAGLGVPVGDTNLGRQTMLFLQYLTEVVRGLKHGAMVYSLQQSVREAVGDEGLLDMLDSLVSRIDAKKEPVAGDDVLRVVQRRLFKQTGDRSVHEAVAGEYATLLERYLTQNADTDAGKRDAEDQAATLRRRIVEAYPFHPELLDLMYLRWGSLASYQRTRGALQFLATVIGALWRKPDSAGALIGPGDVPLDDVMVRSTFFTQVGEREAMKSVLDSDLLGPTARCRRVDEAIGADVPAYRGYQVGTRLTRALALYSFGAKPGEDRGVLRQELLGAVQMPGLTADVLEGALQQLNESLLYIHGSGRRFRFERRPNLNKLLDDEARKVEGAEVLRAVREQFHAQLGEANGNAVVWPGGHGNVPDKKPRFAVVFLGPDHALETPLAIEELVRAWTEQYGNIKRSYRNALAFAVPSPSQLETARTAARRVLAVEALLSDKRQKLEPEDRDDLAARRKRSQTDLAAAVRQMYPTVVLPVPAPIESPDPIRLERFEVQPHHALGGGVVATVHHVLENWVTQSCTPAKVVSASHLGEGDIGTRAHFISGPELVDQFFGSVQFPKLLTLDGIKQAVARGVTEGDLAYVMGATERDGALELTHPRGLRVEKATTAADIDLTEGSYVLSIELARHLLALASEGTTMISSAPPDGTGSYRPPPPPPGGIANGAGASGYRTSRPPPPTGQLTEIRLRFRANATQLFKAWRTLQTLTEWADPETFSATVTIDTKLATPTARNLYETAVLMSLEEADIEIDES